jgi:hypothetical protein
MPILLKWLLPGGEGVGVARAPYLRARAVAILASVRGALEMFISPSLRSGPRVRNVGDRVGLVEDAAKAD